MSATPVSIRRARAVDGAAVAEIYAPYVTGSIATFETEPPSADAMAERIAAKLAEGLPWLIASNSGGCPLGYAYAGRFHPRHAYRFTVEPAVYVDAAAHGRGVGGALYAALLALLMELGYRQAIALVTIANGPSEALHTRFGFERTGTLVRAGYKSGQWIDVGLFQRALASDELQAVAEGDAVREPLALDDSPLWRALD